MDRGGAFAIESSAWQGDAMVRNKVRWGVLGAAQIAIQKVIPAMQQGEWSEIPAIASLDRHKAEAAASALGITKAYGSYEELLRDPEIEAVYNPLPNQLHVPWTLKAVEAGKHVLCEKPLSLTAEEAKALLPARDRTGVKIGEAFMVRTHPQWLRTREIIAAGGIGTLRSIVGFFSYFNRDPANIRNVPEWGGGGLMDIGCYPITTSRFVFREEPLRVMGLIERDPEMKIDRLTSAILDFPSGQSIFACSTQLDVSAGAIRSSGRATAHSETMLRGYFAGLGMENALPRPN
jgi:predicted dehydrogenase